MAFAWFAYFEDADETGVLDDVDRRHLCELLASAPGLLQAHLFTPAAASPPFESDGPPPRLALQADFVDLPSLEAAIAFDGTFAALAIPKAWPSLAGTSVRHQAMLARPFPVPSARPARSPARTCSFLVHYPGDAADLNAWLLHYLTHHPPLMAALPEVRAIEIFTRVDWCDGLPWQRVQFFQRNKLVFDTAAALAVALSSPELEALRADFRRFPPFTGGNLHYPMHTQVVMPRATVPAKVPPRGSSPG